jgi:hypothetical protein
MWQAIVERMKSEFGGTLSSATDWAVSASILIGAVVAAWLLHAAILALVGRLSSERRPFLRSVLDATRNPTRLALLLLPSRSLLPRLGRRSGTFSSGCWGWRPFVCSAGSQRPRCK